LRAGAAAPSYLQSDCTLTAHSLMAASVASSTGTLPILVTPRAYPGNHGIETALAMQPVAVDLASIDLPMAGR